MLDPKITPLLGMGINCDLPMLDNRRKFAGARVLVIQKKPPQIDEDL